MITRALFVAICWFSLLLSQVPAHAQTGDRMVMHSFQEGTNVVFVAVAESSSGPKGIATAHNPNRKERSFRVSQAEFEKIWTTLMSSGADKYAVDTKPSRPFSVVAYYVFSAGHAGEGTNYAVPSAKASDALVALAKQFRKYAK